MGASAIGIGRAGVRTDPRRAAWQLLQAVHEDDAYANLVMPRLVRDVDPRDVSLATELGYGALRRQGSLDAVIAQCAHREAIDSATRDVLRLGAYQLLFMRVPAHAAVDESVRLAKAVAVRGAAGFVNAVLRRVADKTWPQWCTELTEGMDSVDALAVKHSMPPWVIRALMDAYRLDAAGVEPMLVACNEPAAVTVAARPGRCAVEDLLEIPGSQRGRHSPFAVHLPRGIAPGDIAQVRDHRAGVQDEGSQMVAVAVADATVLGVDEQWLDLCAGPGGKAALLASLAAARGAHLTAVEVNPVRAQLVRDALAGAPGDSTVLVADGRAVVGSYSRILIDAPCTGLGALRRRPEARWRKQPSDVPVLAALQRELLDHAATLVTDGGVIGYATCSPHVAETDAIVTRFLRTHPAFTLVGEPMRLRTDRDGTDSMFLALLRRG